MNVLWVTSFAPDMYRCSGERLIRSFLDSRTEGSLLLCVEDDAASEQSEGGPIRKYRLEDSALLSAWLAENRDVIPYYLGGMAIDCDCAEDAGHRYGCYWEWFNRNAARWFRKIASLDYAIRIPGFDAAIWLDADCEVANTVTGNEAESWFGAAAVFYLKSGDRKVVESGVLGLRLNDLGRRWLDLTIARYQTGQFRRYPRWDDGYQFGVTLDSHPEIPAVDLAERADHGGCVLPYSKPGRFLTHEKGRHCYREVML